ncbi:hypothetical protein V8C86DRAFT_1154517 [Haematococcus lacustris]
MAMLEWTSHWQLWAHIAIALYVFRALSELLCGLVRAIVVSLREVPAVTAAGTAVNTCILSKCPALRHFSASPWAPGPASQTVLGLAKHTGSSVYQWREVVVAPDGVELLLDFKAPAGHSQSPSRSSPARHPA